MQPIMVHLTAFFEYQSESDNVVLMFHVMILLQCLILFCVLKQQGALPYYLQPRVHLRGGAVVEIIATRFYLTITSTVSTCIGSKSFATFVSFI